MQLVFNSNWIIFASLGMQVSSFFNSIEKMFYRIHINYMLNMKFHSNKKRTHTNESALELCSYSNILNLFVSSRKHL